MDGGEEQSKEAWLVNIGTGNGCLKKEGRKIKCSLVKEEHRKGIKR